MSFSLRSLGIACLGFSFATFPALPQTQSPVAVTLPLRPLLPASFAGWSQSAAPQKGTSAGDADSKDAAVLQEYGLHDFADTSYAHGGQQVTVRAIRFQDATGTYGAFTFYRRPEMTGQKLGKGGAGDSKEVLFWEGTTLVDVSMQHDGSISLHDVAALAAAIPKTLGPEGIPPSLPDHLPQAGLQRETVRYAIGPLAYAQSGGAIPPSLIGFNQDAEAVTAHYARHDGTGTLTILEYPTPELATARAKALQDAHASDYIRRAGPLVAVATDASSPAAAKKLIGEVHYSADITWDHPEGYISEVKKTARLLLGISYLTGILGGAAILLGLFLGGGRALVRKLRGKPVSTMNDDDFISLKLRE